MGRPKGSKNKNSNKTKLSAGLDGGEWLQRNIEKPDISGMPKLEPIKIPPKSQTLSNQELKDYIREESITYMIELFPANRIQNEKISAMWKECQQKLIKLKEAIFND